MIKGATLLTTDCGHKFHFSCIRKFIATPIRHCTSHSFVERNPFHSFFFWGCVFVAFFALIVFRLQKQPLKKERPVVPFVGTYHCSPVQQTFLVTRIFWFCFVCCRGDVKQLREAFLQQQQSEQAKVAVGIFFLFIVFDRVLFHAGSFVWRNPGVSSNIECATTTECGK